MGVCYEYGALMMTYNCELNLNQTMHTAPLYIWCTGNTKWYDEHKCIVSTDPKYINMFDDQNNNRYSINN